MKETKSFSTLRALGVAAVVAGAGLALPGCGEPSKEPSKEPAHAPAAGTKAASGDTEKDGGSNSCGGEKKCSPNGCGGKK